mgnify:CR=1 FL=1
MSDSPASALAQEVELKFRIPGEDEFNHLLALTRLDDFTPVSYTHLTLPTSDLV